MIKVFINGGGSSPYDQIANKSGWKLGINSGGKSKLNPLYGQKLFMIDNNWKNYNHQQHLRTIEYYRPYQATIRDIEDHVNQQEIEQQIQDIIPLTRYLIIIPKTKIKKQLIEAENIILGLPLRQAENAISWDYARHMPNSVHLLGGSPKKWKIAIEELGEKICSLDGNYLAKIARFGKIYKNWKSSTPHYFEVAEGKNFPYRCFQFSLNWVNKNLNEIGKVGVKQLNLFQI